MLLLRSNIEIKKDNVLKHSFDEVASAIIKSSWDEMTDTAEITLRNKFIKKNQRVITEIERGNKIEMSFGYNSSLVKRFTGYVKKITTDSPFKIYAEDEAWILKQKTITGYSDKQLTVKKLLTALQNKLGLNIPMNIVNANIDYGIGTWEVQNETIIAVLDKLKSGGFGLLSFFRDGELFVGSPRLLASEFPTKYGNVEHEFYFDGSNANIISHDLKWNDETDITQVIKGTVKYPDNKSKTKYAFYLNGVATVQDNQPEGNMITHFWYDVAEKDFIVYLKEELKVTNYTGWHGSFTTFGDAIRTTSNNTQLGGVIRHGDKVYLRSKKEPEKDGKYLVKSVSLEFGTDGYRQNIELHQKLTT